MSYSFRPEIVSGIAAIEMWITGSVNSVFFTPTLFLLACAYSIQHIAEKYSSKQLGFLAAVIFCFFPVVVSYGRTMLLDVAVAGMIISVIHHLLIIIEDGSEKSFLVLGILSGIIGLTKYPYLYFGGMICLVLVAKQMKNQAKFLDRLWHDNWSIFYQESNPYGLNYRSNAITDLWNICEYGGNIK